jgi:hypothetical protein
MEAYRGHQREAQIRDLRRRDAPHVVNYFSCCIEFMSMKTNLLLIKRNM